MPCPRGSNSHADHGADLSVIVLVILASLKLIQVSNKHFEGIEALTSASRRPEPVAIRYDAVREPSGPAPQPAATLAGDAQHRGYTSVRMLVDPHNSFAIRTPPQSAAVHPTGGTLRVVAVNCRKRTASPPQPEWPSRPRWPTAGSTPTKPRSSLASKPTWSSPIAHLGHPPAEADVDRTDSFPRVLTNASFACGRLRRCAISF
jgi:hypothetical protein